MECLFVAPDTEALAYQTYDKHRIKGMLLLIGCKPLYANQITEEILDYFASVTQNGNSNNNNSNNNSNGNGNHQNPLPTTPTLTSKTPLSARASEEMSISLDGMFLETMFSRNGKHIFLQPYFMAVVTRICSRFIDAPTEQLDSDLTLSRRITDREQSVCILLGGTSGCGKSTLASLLASRLGLTTVLSTDNVRHLMRNFMTKEEHPVLYASSYHAGEAIDEDNSSDENIIAGFNAQNDLIFNKLDELISSFSTRNMSLVVEGVHLSVDVMMRLMARHTNCIPFLVFISNEAKHTERFAIRAKYMTLEPRVNKYIKYFGAIRVIQDHLCRQADEHLIPKIDNTNVDRSLAILHRTVFYCLRTLNQRGSSLYDDATKKTTELHAIMSNVIHEHFRGSKEMLRVIRQKRKKMDDKFDDRSEEELRKQDDPDLDESDEHHVMNINELPDFFGSLGS